MSTPILTKREQRYSLSAKKGPSRGLRNILAQPENYWPTVEINQCQSLIDLMNKLLPSIKRPTFKIPGSMLRHMTKEKRALARQEALEKNPAKFDESMSQSIILGINAVTRALEKLEVCCILLDANVEPSFLTKHIIVMAQARQIPVLLLLTLKMITLETIGFATAALALKIDVAKSLDNNFHVLYQTIVEVFQTLPSKYSMRLFKSDESSDEKTINFLKKLINTPKLTCVDITEKEEQSVLTDPYKYRSSRNERAFVPPAINNSSQRFSRASSDEFIALSDKSDFTSDKDIRDVSKKTRYVRIPKEKTESENVEKGTTRNDKSMLIDSNVNSWQHTESHMSKKRKADDVTYLSLKVKRVQGNNNRLKATKFTKKKKK